MSVVRKATIAFALAVGFGNPVQAQKTSDASFLLTQESGKIVFDVLVDNPSVTVFDLMIPVGSLKLSDADLSRCAAGVGGAHVGGCNIADGELRMVVFSPQNATLESGRIGSVGLPGISFDASDVRIRAYDKAGDELKVEVLSSFPSNAGYKTRSSGIGKAVINDRK